jgi:hypothetical protein
MKKILALTSLIFALSVGATAMAADDTSVTKDPGAVVNYETVKANGYTTVLVHKADDINNIVYVDQADDTFGAALTLMLKADMDDGEYTMKLGGAGKETIASNFTLKTNSGSGSTDPDPAPTVEMGDPVATTNNSDGTKNAAYETLVTSNYNKIKFTCSKNGVQKTATIAIDGIDNLTGVAANVVVLVKNVPVDVTIDSVALVNVTENN